MSKVDVLCIGKTTIDQFLLLSAHNVKYHFDSRTGSLSFKHGEKISVEQFAFCMGGNASNVAVGLTRLGLSAILCSEVGDDEFSEKIDKILKKEKIDTSHMLKTQGAESSFSVIINFLGERTIFMQRTSREHRFKYDDVLPEYLFLTSLEKEWRSPYLTAFEFVKKTGCKLAFNPGTIQLKEGGELIEKILRKTDLLFVNKEEAEQIVFGNLKRKQNNSSPYIRGLLVKLKEMGVGMAVVTNGRRGSHAIDTNGKFYHLGLWPGEAVERTGAGDAYTTGFLAATILGKGVDEAMRWGAINSTSVVEKIGATEGLLTKNMIEKFLSERKGDILPETKGIGGIFGRIFRG